jgi:hypothetical protein
VNVSGFDPSQPARSAKIVDCAVKYICPGTGDIIMLTINQALHIPELEHVLLCSMQCRVNGVVIDECPKFMASNPIDSTHSITIQNDNSDLAHPLIIPLRLERVVSYFEFSKPTPEEYDDKDIPHYVLTAKGPDWDPYDDSFAGQEDGMLNYWGQAVAVCKSDGSCTTVVVMVTLEIVSSLVSTQKLGISNFVDLKCNTLRWSNIHEYICMET